MNLKLVVASMSVLGLVSWPVFAAEATTTTDTSMTTSTTAPVVKTTRHRHKVRHRTVAATPAPEYKDYKDYKDMPVACTVSPTAETMTEMTQNVGRALPNPCNPGWYNRIQVSGGVNVDIGKFGNRNVNYMGENYQTLSLNDAYLNVSANVDDWATAFASLSYNTATIASNNGFPSIYKGFGAAEYSAAYSNNVGGSNNQAIQLEQAFMTLGNFNESPIFLQIGKQFQDFGRYEIHPITRTMTQSMSETLATSLKLGFLANGFNGSVYVFDNPLNKVGGGNQPQAVWGAALGYDMPSDVLGWDIGVGYLGNIIAVNDVAWNVANYNGATSYNKSVGGVALYGDVNSGPFTLGARYTTAASRFNVNDLPKNGVADLVGGRFFVPGTGPAGANTPVAGATGARPWAAGLIAGYGFTGWNYNQNIYLGYQATGEAAGLNLPKNRWTAGWGVDAWKNTNVAIQWDHDTAYRVANGGTGNSSNLVTIRAGVKFS